MNTASSKRKPVMIDFVNGSASSEERKNDTNTQQQDRSGSEEKMRNIEIPVNDSTQSAKFVIDGPFLLGIMNESQSEEDVKKNGMSNEKPITDSFLGSDQNCRDKATESIISIVSQNLPYAEYKVVHDILRNSRNEALPITKDLVRRNFIIPVIRILHFKKVITAYLLFKPDKACCYIF